ncbi:MAG: hypothetical protein M0D55_18395 [Elusimicrobiota bacterium]|nr:MAG: hypothetical protein M0D55_18395 [Elusimicrobiota bacterium]
MKALKIIGFGAAGLLVVVLAAAVAVVAVPSSVLNTQSLQWAAKKFGAPYRPTWQVFALSIDSTNLLVKRVRVQGQDVCVDAEDGSVKGCVEDLDVDVTLKLFLRP